MIRPARSTTGAAVTGTEKVTHDIETHPRGTPTAWAAVVLLVVSLVLFTFALTAQIWPLAAAGGVVGFVGLAFGRVSRIMEQVH
jgi:hypothetical protein